jgi:hypothetical protein
MHTGPGLRKTCFLAVGDVLAENPKTLPGGPEPASEEEKTHGNIATNIGRGVERAATRLCGGSFLTSERPVQATDPPARTSLVPYLLLSAAAGLWFSLGEIHQNHNSDSLIPVLVSLYRWTFFYWEQDRFGMLVPLLATPFPDPLTNVIVQNAITATAGIAAWFLAARYLIRDDYWPAAGAVAAAGSLLSVRELSRFVWLSTFQPYNVSLALGLTALVAASGGRVALRPGRLAGALALAILASWVNAAVPLLLLPLVAFHAIFGAPPTSKSDSADAKRTFLARLAGRAVRVELVPAVPVLLAGLAFSMIAQRLAPYRTTWLVVPTLDRWVGLGRDMCAGVATDLGTFWLWSLVPVVTILPLWSMKRVRARASRTIGTVVTIALTVFVYGALMAVLFQARSRYFTPAIVLVQLAVATMTVAPIALAVGVRGSAWLRRSAVALLLASIACLNGVPSVDRVRADLDRTLGQLTPDLLAGGSTHFAGDYWTVWKAVFHANLVLHERSPGQKVWGLSHRSLPTQSQWSGVAPNALRIATVPGDAEAEPYLRQYKFPPLRRAARVGRLDIWVSDGTNSRESTK